jgi:hypothetical protein
MNENDNQNPVRRSIDDLLRDDDNLPELRGDTLPAFDEHVPLNYTEVKDKSLGQAKKLMDSLLKFYLSEDLIKKNEYVLLKAKTDVMTMSNLINQMQIAEHAITTLMRTIDTGQLSPRRFEVLGGLQKTMLDIMKHQTLHMMAAEENMKKLKRDIDVYSDNVQDAKVISSTTGSVSRGTRNLMRDIQAELGNEDVEDTDFDSENQEEM